MSETTYQDPASPRTVSVTGPGVNISVPVGADVMAAVIGLLFGGTPIAAPAVETPHAPNPHAGPSVDAEPETTDDDIEESFSDHTLGEFIDEHNPTTFPQRICTAGYYLTVVKGQTGFSREDIRSAMQKAHEEMPGNFSRDFNKAVSQRLVAENTDAGYFYISRTGKRAVESRFSDVPKPRPRRSPRKAATSSEAAE